MNPMDIGVEHAEKCLDEDVGMATKMVLYRERARDAPFTPGWPAFVAILQQEGVAPSIDWLEHELQRPPTSCEILEFERGFMLTLAFNPGAMRVAVTKARFLQACEPRTPTTPIELAYLKRADARAQFADSLRRTSLALKHWEKEPEGKHKDRALRSYEGILAESQRDEADYVAAHEAWVRLGGEPLVDFAFTRPTQGDRHEPRLFLVHQPPHAPRPARLRGHEPGAPRSRPALDRAPRGQQ